MKRIITATLSLIVLLNVSTSTAQNGKSNASTSAGGAHCFDENSKILNLGVGFGGSYYRYNRGHGYSYRQTPAFSLTYEQALKEKVGPGFIGVGAYLGYRSARLRYDDYYYAGNKYYYQYRWNYIVLAARGAYHLDILNTNKAELYFGAIAGIRIQTYKYETNSTDPYRDQYDLAQRNIYPALSLFVGGRWYFKPNIGLFGEVGYGISYLTLGLSFKL
jgi:hypothetical protein